ncbi:MAG: thrombospondin type 3 repeat-containing protein [Verrucomicrobiales bacterium]|nr:thrombospondin type 3 repeat-containing protein [Verrucomicrobiales bacterium]
MKSHSKLRIEVRRRHFVILAGILLLVGLTLVVAQEFRIQEVKVDGTGLITIRYNSDPASRFVLLQGPTVTNITMPVVTNSGVVGSAVFTQPVGSANREVYYRIREDVSAGARDSDGDGLTDAAEINVHHTDPEVPDTDGDGWNDGVEIAAETNPNDSGSRPMVFAAQAIDLALPKVGNGSAVSVAGPAVDIVLPASGNGAGITVATPGVDLALPANGNASAVFLGQPSVDLFIPLRNVPTNP